MRTPIGSRRVELVGRLCILRALLAHREAHVAKRTSFRTILQALRRRVLLTALHAALLMYDLAPLSAYSVERVDESSLVVLKTKINNLGIDTFLLKV